MQRRKPISAKQRKEQLQLKRAVKRGDVPAPPPTKPDRHRKGRRGPTGQLVGSAATRIAVVESTRRLESSFVKLPPAFLEKTKVLASTLPLSRPIPPALAILPDVDKGPPVADHKPGQPAGQDSELTLICPRRPKWRYDMSKKEVEANEEGLFRKWLAQTDATVNAWCDPNLNSAGPAPSSSLGGVSAPTLEASGNNIDSEEADAMLRAPTSFERNLEVWRQLWRVAEISQILLILLDSRCPTLHFPPALASYLATTSNASRLRTILVLTKVDISGPHRAAAWTTYLNTLYPDVRVVPVESYSEKYSSVEGSSNARKRMFEPHLPSTFRQSLVEALRQTHVELLEPPQAIKNNPDRLASWKPRIKTEVDWDAVLKAHGGQVGTAVGGAAAPKPPKTAPEEYTREDQPAEADSEPEVLTIGLIGQPNVGKSSLLNALFGTQKVRASRTPGKTKHFQTLFWTPEVRLVDCPGLVIPNYVPMETQVLSGILPISRVSAIPLCVYHAARLLPLEKILGLAHPSLSSPPAEDKRTWRDGMRPRDATPGEQPEPVWTAMDILTAYASKKGWVTAKAGRPDVNRAGNAILRALAEGRMRWAFWPPGTDPEIIRAHQEEDGVGIWIAHDRDGHEDIDVESADGDEDAHAPSPADSDEDDEAESEAASSDHDADADEGEWESNDRIGGTVQGTPGTRPRVAGTAGRFGALVLDDQDEEGDSE